MIKLIFFETSGYNFFTVIILFRSNEIINITNIIMKIEELCRVHLGQVHHGIQKAVRYKKISIWTSPTLLRNWLNIARNPQETKEFTEYLWKMRGSLGKWLIIYISECVSQVLFPVHSSGTNRRRCCRFVSRDSTLLALRWRSWRIRTRDSLRYPPWIFLNKTFDESLLLEKENFEFLCV